MAGGARSGRSWRRRGLAGVVAASLVAIAGATWWLRYDVRLDLFEGGFTSDELDWVDVQGLRGSDRLFRCEAGELTLVLGIAAEEARFSPTLTEVSVPLLDDVWADEGYASRTASMMMADSSGAVDDVIPFRPTELGSDVVARLQLSWELDSCSEIDGVLAIEEVAVGYELLGRRRTATVPLVQPLHLTTSPLTDFTER